MDNKFDQYTIEIAVLEILDATGISQLSKEEKDKLSEDIRQQLSAAVAIELINNLGQSDKEIFFETLKAGNVDQVLRMLLGKVENSEERATHAVAVSKDNFLKNYFSKLPTS